MTVVKKDKVKCDLCQSVVSVSQAYPLAEGDRFEHLCHKCILDGWVTYCAVCWHSCTPEELDLLFRCKKCQELDQPIPQGVENVTHQ